MGKEFTFYIRVQLVLRIYNPNSIHELLARKSPNKLFNEEVNYSWTLFFHFFCHNIPIIMSAHNKDPH